jgi:hypothetical protein
LVERIANPTYEKEFLDPVPTSRESTNNAITMPSGLQAVRNGGLSDGKAAATNGRVLALEFALQKTAIYRANRVRRVRLLQIRPQ